MTRRGDSGIADIDGKKIFVERIRVSELTGYATAQTRRLMAALTRASGRSPPPAPTPADGEFVSDVARGEQLVARAQRAIRSKSDNDRWLREQMSRLSDPQFKALTNDIFTDSGALRVSLAEVNARLARMHTADAAGGSAAEALSGDGNATEARVLPILRTSLGVRHRDFRSAVEAMRGSAWEDWPLTGPRTVLFVLTFIAEHFQTPEQRHARFVADGKLQPTDVGVSDHQVVMKMLHYTELCVISLIYRRWRGLSSPAGVPSLLS